MEKSAAIKMEVGRLLFTQSCNFIMGARKEADLPQTHLPEIAFAGRSNVGKSSLLNALTTRRSLARPSNTPGRTREVNFFSIGKNLMLVDLPGYGYARAPKSEISRWNRLIEDYLRGRSNLRKVCLLVDARRGIGDPDRKVMKLLDQAAVGYQVILTKIDKEKSVTLIKVKAAIEVELKQHGAAHPKIFGTSAAKGLGLEKLRAAIATLVEEDGLRYMQNP